MELGQDASDTVGGGQTPRALCDVHALLDDQGSPSAGIVWKLAEARRQLDANLVHLAPGQVIGEHTERDLDVLLIALAGTATLTPDPGSGGGADPLAVHAGELVWLPRGTTRTLAAGAMGLSYLTVHQRRAGMWIGVRP